MKTRIFKFMAVMALLLTAIPMHSQNYLKIWFKDGHTERHFMHLVQNISTTKYDLEGNLHPDYQMQQIVMPDTTYSYYLADIDSMSFRKVDDHKVLTDIKTTATFVESKLQQCDFTEMESYLSEIKSLDGVEDAYIEESSLIVDIVDWGSLCYHTSHDSETDLHDFANFLKVNKHNSVQKAWPITCNNTVKVALLNQQSNDLKRKQYLGMLELQEKFKTMGFDAHYIPSEELSVAFFLDDVFQYDIVYLNTHGIYTKKKHWFMTGEVLSIDKLPAEAEPGLLYKIFIGPSKKDVDIDGIIYSHCAEEGRERINEGKTDTVKVNVYYKTISEEVIANSKSHFEKDNNTIFFNAACQSMKKNDSMAKIYTEGKLADVYFGYDDDSNTTKDLLAAYTIFEHMLNGYSLEAAISRLKEERNIPDPNYEHQNDDLIDQYNYHKNEDGKIDREWIAHLEEVDASDYTKLFIVRTYTEESQKQNISEEYFSNGNVTLEGITSIANKETISNLRCGFRYGLDPTLMISYKNVFCDNLEYIENENGNIRFSIPISDIQPGQIIFYRAFTYDGFNYNYGDIKVLTVPKVPDLALSSTSINLMVGYSSSVWINSGSGSYTAATSNSSVATCSIEDAYVVITPVGVGNCTITVTDTGTGEKAEIVVNVNTFEEMTDCTDYIQNASFDEDLTWRVDGSPKPGLTQGTTLSDRTIAWLAPDGSRYAKVNPNTPNSRSDGRTFDATNGFIGTIKGWETVLSSELQGNDLCEWVYFGSLSYGMDDDALPVADDGTGYIVVPKKPDAFSDNDNTGVLHLRAGWGNQCSYRQVVNLPAANYRLEYYIRNTNAAMSSSTSGVKNLCSVTCNGEVFIDDEGFNSEGWVKHSIDFKATDSFTIEFGFQSAAKTSNVNPQLWIDCIKLYKVNTDVVSECTAKITGVELTSAEYYRGEDHPNELHFSVSAKLDDLRGIEEWGIYYANSPDNIEFPFNEVAYEQSTHIYYHGPEGWRYVDVDSYVAELSDEVGVYVKSRNSSSGELVTYYSNDMFSYTLRYDKKPSYVFSNPVITSTEVINDNGDNIQYKTSTSFHYVLEGAFWIDNIINETSGEGWSITDSDPWYPVKDKENDATWNSTYWSNSENLNHSSWKVLNLRNSQTLRSSNVLNWTGEKTITNVWVSSTPAYSRMKQSANNSQYSATGNACIQEVEQSDVQNSLSHSAGKYRSGRKEYQYKDCILGRYLSDTEY